MTDEPLHPLRQIRRWQDRLLREDFTSFIEASFKTVNPGTPFLPSWHIELIAEYLEAARKGEIRRLIINMPPRALKSVCVTVAWPAFLLGHDPAVRIIAASYAASLAVKHSLDTRVIMQAGWYRTAFSETELKAGENEKQKFLTTKRGFRMATSVGGSVTGEGGDVLIVDDPLHPIQAIGACTRCIANRWFDHTFSSRLNNKKKGVIVIVMHRLHPEDLTGHLLEKGGWELLKLPALAPEKTLIDFGSMHKIREAGEPLHEAREDVAVLARVKADLGTQAFEAQYQQNPLPMEGGLIRRHWFARYEVKSDYVRVIQSWDTGIKTLASHDPSVCITMGERKEGYDVLDVWCMREEYPGLRRAVLAQAEAWKPDAILMEDKASGQSLLQDLRQETALALIGIKPTLDKLTRLAQVSALIEAGKLFLPKQARWLQDFEAELLSFPHAAHDDQVDALSQGLQWLKTSRAGQIGMRRV